MKTRLKKHLGQHLLTDIDLLTAIVDEAGVGAGDAVLEIGPGPGGLSALLARAVGPQGHLVCVELDTDFRSRLEHQLGKVPWARVVWGDILRTDLSEFLEDGRSWKVVANIPYYITAPIVEKLLSHLPCLHSLALLMQAEVAHRLHAECGRLVGTMSYFVHNQARTRVALEVPPEAFTPPPKVHSALLVLHPLPKPRIATSEARVFELIAWVFRERRKMLRRSLRGFWGVPEPALEVVLTRSAVRGEQRPEELTLEQFACLADNLQAALARDL